MRGNEADGDKENVPEGEDKRADEWGTLEGVGAFESQMLKDLP